MLLVCGEAEEDADFEPIVKTYEAIANFCKWNNLGYYLAKGVYKKGDILKTDALPHAAKLGENI
ncbi:hypothetical protein LJC10_04335 [Selenomonadales bacterium OttesenSCG-928-I06]|nr:hypothetical protein [Selenomonadales bacterium OttesenSCG-928-I06]